MPGDNLTANLKLNFPLPIVKGQRFALREGGKTVAAGVITKLLEDSEADIKEEEERIAKNKAGKWAKGIKKAIIKNQSACPLPSILCYVYV